MALDGLLDALGYAGDSIDKFGGRALRGALGGKPRELMSVIPFSDRLGITDPKDIVYGGELAKKLGVIREGATPFDTGLASFATEAVLDPLNLLAGGTAVRAMSRGRKADTGAGLLGKRSGVGKFFRDLFKGDEGSLGLKYDTLPGETLNPGDYGLRRSDPEWVNNKTFYHGTVSDLASETLDPTKTSRANIHGRGIYTIDEGASTRSLPVSSFYATSKYNEQPPGMGLRPKVYQAKSEFEKILDLDEPLESHAKLANQILEAISQKIGHTPKYLFGPQSIGDAIGEHSAHTDINRLLKELGYDAYTYGDEADYYNAQYVMGLDPNDAYGVGRKTPYSIWEVVKQLASQEDGSLKMPDPSQGAAADIFEKLRSAIPYAKSGAVTPGPEWEAIVDQIDAMGLSRDVEKRLYDAVDNYGLYGKAFPSEEESLASDMFQIMGSEYEPPKDQGLMGKLKGLLGDESGSLGSRAVDNAMERIAFNTVGDGAGKPSHELFNQWLAEPVSDKSIRARAWNNQWPRERAAKDAHDAALDRLRAIALEASFASHDLGDSVADHDELYKRLRGINGLWMPGKAGQGVPFIGGMTDTSAEYAGVFDPSVVTGRGFGVKGGEPGSPGTLLSPMKTEPHADPASAQLTASNSLGGLIKDNTRGMRLDDPDSFFRKSLEEQHPNWIAQLKRLLFGESGSLAAPRQESRSASELVNEMLDETRYGWKQVQPTGLDSWQARTADPYAASGASGLLSMADTDDNLARRMLRWMRGRERDISNYVGGQPGEDQLRELRTSVGSSGLNSYLRGTFPGEVPPDLLRRYEAAVKGLDENQTLTALPWNAKLFRGMPGGSARRLSDQAGFDITNPSSIGRTFSDPGYLSTTPTPEYAAGYAPGGPILGIDAKRGTPAFMGELEELVLPRDTQLTITDILKRNSYSDKPVVQVEPTVPAGRFDTKNLMGGELYRAFMDLIGEESGSLATAPRVAGRPGRLDVNRELRFPPKEYWQELLSRDYSPENYQHLDGESYSGLTRSLDTLDSMVRNNMAETMPAARAKVIGDAFGVDTDINPYSLDDFKAAFFYGPGRNSIQVNQSHWPWFDKQQFGLEGFRDMWDGRFSWGDIDSTMMHEVGHSLHHKNLGQISPAGPDAALDFLQNTKPDSSLGGQVSGYARGSYAELIAEMFAAMAQGRTYPEDAMAAYSKLGGPPVTSDVTDLMGRIQDFFRSEGAAVGAQLPALSWNPLNLARNLGTAGAATGRQWESLAALANLAAAPAVPASLLLPEDDQRNQMARLATAQAGIGAGLSADLLSRYAKLRRLAR
jgi:hypothetical protein